MSAPARRSSIRGDDVLHLIYAPKKLVFGLMLVRRGIRFGLGLRRGQAKIDDKTISRSP
jgi:hypothetical protein